ncbi:MAG: A24 family peptidase [Planctomycetota bacterium]|jgi:prepilin peptidase CpaA
MGGSPFLTPARRPNIGQRCFMTHNAVAMVMLGVLVVVAGVLDWRTHKVHNAWVAPMTLLGLVFWIVAGAIESGGWGGAVDGLTRSVAAWLAGLIPFYLIYAMGGLGGGDVKLMGAVGAVSGSWQCVLATAMYSLVIAALLALALMIRHGLVRRTARRLFGAALQAAGRVKPDLDDNTPRVPFAAAVSVGGIVAGLETLLGVRGPWAGFG